MANHLEYYIREVLQDFEKSGRLKASVSDLEDVISNIQEIIDR